MDEEILKKIQEQDEKLNAIFRSVEKTRKYIIWKTVFNIIIFILPLIGLAFIIPWFYETFKSSYWGLGI